MGLQSLNPGYPVMAECEGSLLANELGYSDMGSLKSSMDFHVPFSASNHDSAKLAVSQLQPARPCSNLVPIASTFNSTPSARADMHTHTCGIEQQRSMHKMLSIEEVLDFSDSTTELPSIHEFFHFVQKSKQAPYLADAKRVHEYMCFYGVESDIWLGNYLVPVFVSCGDISSAEQLFHRLNCPNEYSWTALIQGYMAHAEEQHTLNMYLKMLDYSVCPSRHTFVAVLKSCAKPEFSDRGRAMHAEITKRGYHSDTIIGTALVDMYIKCGLLMEARVTFDGISVRNVISWTTLMTGYVENGLGAEALVCLEEMQQDGVSPDTFTYVCTLKACGIIGAIEEGRKLHDEIREKGMLKDSFVGNTLVDMYAKCNSLKEAKAAFHELLLRDAISWTALIGAYVDHGLSQDALNCWKQMMVEGVCPVAATFVCSLKACINIEAIDMGRAIHVEAVKEGFDTDDFVSNTLLEMYAKFDLITEAEDVFHELRNQGIVAWTILIAAYTELGLNEEVLNCLEQMQGRSMSPDVVAFVCSLKACGILGAIHKGCEIHNEIIIKGFGDDLYVGNTLACMYARYGLLAEAKKVFDMLRIQDVVSWNGLIKGYLDHGHGEEALDFFHEMQLVGVCPDAVTLTSSLKASATLGAIGRAQEIHCYIATRGLETEVLLGNTLVSVYAKCGLFAEARELLDKLPVRDVVSWNALMTGYAESKNSEEALSCFHQMQLEGLSPDIATWNTMILSFSEEGEKQSAFLLLALMIEQSLLPDAAIFVSILKTCENPSNLQSARRFHAQLCASNGGVETSDVALQTTLIDVYSKCGSMVDAQLIFDSLPAKGLATWNALITGYACQGESDSVFKVFAEMRRNNIQPDEITFLSILNACSHAGLLEKGQKYFEVMGPKFGVTPNIEHHTCIIDLFGRLGQLGKAVEIIERLPYKPDMIVWHTLLSACQKWGDVELGRQAFQRATKMDEMHAGAYISMGNVYADT